MDSMYSLLQVGGHKLLLRQCSLGWEVVHLDYSDYSPEELDELATAFTELGVCGLSSDATRNECSTVRLASDYSNTLEESQINLTGLKSNVTFAKFTGTPSLRRLSERDLFQVNTLCSQSECHKGAGVGALCFREVSGRNKVTFSDGGVERDVVIVKVESSNSDRFKAHTRFSKLLAAHGVGPQLYSSECSADAQFYFTERLGTCTTLKQYLESSHTQPLTEVQLEASTRSLAAINSILANDNSKEACFHYRGESYREFLQDALVDVATGRVYLWRTRHVSYFHKNSWEESLPLGYDLNTRRTKRTKSDCTRTLWSFLLKASDSLRSSCITPQGTS
jgi:hypothetical protein